jgi:hypothetical protein
MQDLVAPCNPHAIFHVNCLGYKRHVSRLHGIFKIRPSRFQVTSRVNVGIGPAGALANREILRHSPGSKDGGLWSDMVKIAVGQNSRTFKLTRRLPDALCRFDCMPSQIHDLFIGISVWPDIR